MNKTLEAIYEHAPIPLQNLMVTVYGYQLHRLRYGGNWSRYLAELEKSQWFSAEQLEALQMQRLSSLLNHVYESVPYYRHMFDQHDIHPHDIRSLSDLSRIPILRKKALRDSPEELVARGIDKKTLIRDHTSGTTGTAVVLYNTLDTHQWHWAFVERFRHWAGVKVGDKRASFGVRMVAPFEQIRPPFWRYNAVERQLFFSIYHLAPDNLPVYNEALKRFDPTSIETYPSAIYTLARFILDKGLETAHPKAIITTAETLFDYQRQAIQQAFGCRVYDWYGSSEFVAFACECPEGGLHVNSEFGVLEILKEDETPASPGEWGKIIATGFVNRAQPLIRFEIGDMGIWADRKCPCGRRSPLLETVTGRIEDVVVTPDGRLIARFDPIFKDTRNVVEAQIIQESLSELRVKLVRGRDYSAEDTVGVLEQFRRRCGDQMQVQLEFVDQIPRTKAGKFRAVISNASSPFKYQVPEVIRE
jgi:phenylacetate-CoA ligase